MPGMVFAFLMTLVNLGAVILILLIIIQAQNRAAVRRQQNFQKALESGVYDKRLLGKTRSGHAMLGWGIFFVAVGIGIMVALRSSPVPLMFRQGIAGAVIPLFIGIAMIVFYYIARGLSRSREDNDKPVVLDRENGKKPSSIPTYDS